MENETSGDYRKTLLVLIDKAEDKKNDSKKDTKEKKDKVKSQQVETARSQQKETAGSQKKETVTTKDSSKDKQKDEIDKRSNDVREDGKEKDSKINDEDVVKLYNAMKGLGTDEDTLTEVITRNTNSQRQMLKKRYHELYKQVRL